jgi:hypothetical protein
LQRAGLKPNTVAKSSFLNHDEHVARSDHGLGSRGKQVPPVVASETPEMDERRVSVAPRLIPSRVRCVVG